MDAILLKAILDNGWEWVTIKLVLLIVCVVFGIIAAKNFFNNTISVVLTREFAYRRVKAIKAIKIGCGIRFTQPFEYLHGTLMEVNRHHVLIQTDATLEIIPIILFDSMQKSVVNEPESDTDA